ncbi:MAG: conjugal transfer protein [Solirubrobacteraceae bacterium]
MRRSTGTPDARVRIGTRPLWQIRVAREWHRWLLSGAAVAGLVASARFAIDPPRPPVPRTAAQIPAAPDLAAEGFAVRFARVYLTWNAAEPQAREDALAPFVGPGIDPGAGLAPPANGAQRVESAEVVQERELTPADPAGSVEHVYTVAAQTDEAGLLYLTVAVVRTPDGSLALGGYPAFVGAPASGPAQAGTQTQRREVTEPALATVVGRALRNYLAASASELAADLTASAHVSLPEAALGLESVQRLDWAPGAGAVLAVVAAADARGAHYTLAYELDVVRVQGRWEIAAIEMDPDA